MSYFSLSPSVEFTETDLTTGLTAVASSVGALAGEFEWGPVMDVIQVTNEADLVARFGKPNNNTFNHWYTAYNFLQYSSDLRLVRVSTAAQRNAVTSGTSIAIKNLIDWETRFENGGNGVGLFAAKYPGSKGNSIKVSIADKNSFTRTLTGTVSITSGSNQMVGVGTVFSAQLQVGDKIKFVKGGSPVLSAGSEVELTIATVDTDLAATFTSNAPITNTAMTANCTWEYAYLFSGAPIDSDQAVASGASNDGIHMVVLDVDGKISGVRGQVLEAFENLSKAANARKFDGSAAYYKNALRDSSWVWWMDHPTSGALTPSGLEFGDETAPGTYKSFVRPLTYTLSGGADGFGATEGELQSGISIFADDQKYDISLLMTGKVSANVARFAIQNVAEKRRDCVAFVSPVDTSTGNVIVGDTSESIDKIIAFRNQLNGSSYAFLDSGFKYQYDKYNDVYRWIALNGDCAGVTARSIFDRNEWASPAGFNRGSVKNVTRLAVNPNKPQRDRLFQASVNFVVSFPGSGPILFSDKTLLDRPSDFDAIGIRLLFILMEKSIASSAKFFLFEQNNELTRKLFVSMITPFLRDIQGRGGITDFYVDVGPSVNTPSVIQSKTFAANIYVKSTKSIRFIKLNFIATPEGVAFSEITGQ